MAGVAISCYPGRNVFVSLGSINNTCLDTNNYERSELKRGLCDGVFLKCSENIPIAKYLKCYVFHVIHT